MKACAINLKKSLAYLFALFLILIGGIANSTEAASLALTMKDIKHKTSKTCQIHKSGKESFTAEDFFLYYSGYIIYGYEDTPDSKFMDKVFIDVLKNSYNCNIDKWIEVPNGSRKSLVEILWKILDDFKLHYHHVYRFGGPPANDLGVFNYWMPVVKKALGNDETEKVISFLNDFSRSINYIYAFNRKMENMQFEQQQANKIAKAKAEKKKKEDHIRSIKSGKKPIKSLNDAKIFFDAENGMSIVTNPPLDPDNNYYAIAGKLSRKEGEYYLFEHKTDNNIYYFYVKFSNKTSKKGLRIGYRNYFVAKFMDITEYKTVVETVRYAPIFEAHYMTNKFSTL